MYPGSATSGLPSRHSEQPVCRRAPSPTEFPDVRLHLQADAYAGFDKLYGARIVEVACWAHARRKIFDVHDSTKSPIAAEALAKIGELYRIEAAIRGRRANARRDVRQSEARPLLAVLKAWFEAQLAKLPPKGGLAQAIRYSLSNWPALTRYLDDGRLEIDNNRAENTLRGVALGRKNWLFAGSDSGGARAAAIYGLIETCKLNGVKAADGCREPAGGGVGIVGGAASRVALQPAIQVAEDGAGGSIRHVSGGFTVRAGPHNRE